MSLRQIQRGCWRDRRHSQRKHVARNGLRCRSNYLRRYEGLGVCAWQELWNLVETPVIERPVCTPSVEFVPPYMCFWEATAHAARTVRAEQASERDLDREEASRLSEVQAVVEQEQLQVSCNNPWLTYVAVMRAGMERPVGYTESRALREEEGNNEDGSRSLTVHIDMVRYQHHQVRPLGWAEKAAFS